jgi:2-dehydropantoate 2-reductase
VRTQEARKSDVMFNRIFILGAGAIGSPVGALLSKNNDVTLIGNKAQVNAVNSKGLSVLGDVNETFHLRADTQIRDIPQKALILLTTKAYDSESAMKGIGNLFREDTVVLVLQNGLGNEEVVKRVVNDKAKVLRGITTMAGEFFKAGEVKYWKGDTFIENDAASAEVANVLNACGLKASVCMNIRDKIWSKAVVNSVVNPLTAIFRVRNREIGTQTLAPVRRHIVRECVHVGNSEGITFPQDLEKSIETEIGGYTNFSSMCQDIMKGKKTEIDFLNGKIVELGGKHNIPTPINETIVSFMKFLEGKNELSGKN